MDFQSSVSFMKFSFSSVLSNHSDTPVVLLYEYLRPEGLSTISSSNSIMANNLFKLGKYYASSKYNDHAETMLNNVKSNAVRYGAGASNWLNLYLNFIGEYYEIAICGDNAERMVKELNTHYLPNKLVAGNKKASQLPLLQDRFQKDITNIYICIEGACKLPVTEIKKAVKELDIRYK